MLSRIYVVNLQHVNCPILRVLQRRADYESAPLPEEDDLITEEETKGLQAR
jgi:hypothetical protein